MMKPTSYDLEQTRIVMAIIGELLFAPMLLCAVSVGLGMMSANVLIGIGLVQLFLFGPVLGIMAKGLGTFLCLVVLTYIALFKGEL